MDRSPEARARRMRGYWRRVEEIEHELGTNIWPQVHMLRGVAVAGMRPFCRRGQFGERRRAIASANDGRSLIRRYRFYLPTGGMPHGHRHTQSGERSRRRRYTLGIDPIINTAISLYCSRESRRSGSLRPSASPGCLTRYAPALSR